MLRSKEGFRPGLRFHNIAFVATNNKIKNVFCVRTRLSQNRRLFSNNCSGRESSKIRRGCIDDK